MEDIAWPRLDGGQRFASPAHGDARNGIRSHLLDEFDPKRGELKPLLIVTTLPPAFTGNIATSEIAPDPSREFVHGSNRGRGCQHLHLRGGQSHRHADP